MLRSLFRSHPTALAQETAGADPEAQVIQVQARTSLSKKASQYTTALPSRIGQFQGSLRWVRVVQTMPPSYAEAEELHRLHIQDSLVTQ